MTRKINLQMYICVFIGYKNVSSFFWVGVGKRGYNGEFRRGRVEHEGHITRPFTLQVVQELNSPSQ